VFVVATILRAIEHFRLLPSVCFIGSSRLAAMPERVRERERERERIRYSDLNPLIQIARKSD